MRTGVFPGMASHFGSRSRIFARVCGAVSPWKTLAPVSASYRQQPKAQMSVRLSTALP